MDDQDLKFTANHIAALRNLLWPVKDQCQNIYIALGFDPDDLMAPEKQVGALYATMITTIVNKGTTKQQLVTALKSGPVGHGELAEKLKADTSIENGMLKNVAQIANFLLPAKDKCIELVKQLNVDPHKFKTISVEDSLTDTIERLVNDKGVTRNMLVKALCNPMVESKAVADRLLQFDFDAVDGVVPQIDTSSTATPAKGADHNATGSTPTSDQGRSNGETKMINNSGAAEVYQWNAEHQDWIKIGDAIGKAPSGNVYNNEEFDYVFDIELDEGGPTMRKLKLPYNRDTDPYVAAENFLSVNNLPSYYLDQVAEFIIQNAGEYHGPSSTTAADPFTDQSATQSTVTVEPVDSEVDWSFKRKSAKSLHPVTIPQPPEKDANLGLSEPYKMTAKCRGIAIIINQKEFVEPRQLPTRTGTDVDAESLNTLFKDLGFCTQRYDNLVAKDFRKKLLDVADQDHSEYDCLMVAILTHGSNGNLFSRDGQEIPVKEITSYFNGISCPSLVGKPKVFLLQACRGSKDHYGVSMNSSDFPEGNPGELTKKQVDWIIEQDEKDGGGYDTVLPNEADYLLAYATLPGYISWRNRVSGSWFIQTFVQVMREIARKQHLLDILTEVNNRVAKKFSEGKSKQMPAPVTTLLHRLYF